MKKEKEHTPEIEDYNIEVVDSHKGHNMGLDRTLINKLESDVHTPHETIDKSGTSSAEIPIIKTIKDPNSFLTLADTKEQPSYISHKRSDLHTVSDFDEFHSGDDVMDSKYATKEELKTLETKIDGQFNTLNATIKGGFDTAKAENETRFAELEAKQTKWFVGTAIAIIALVVTLVKLI